MAAARTRPRMNSSMMKNRTTVKSRISRECGLPVKPWKNAGRILPRLLIAGSSFICGEVFLFPYLARSFLWIPWNDVLLIQ